MAESDAFPTMLRKLTAGDADAAAVVFNPYATRLIGLARRQLESRVRSKLDPDDVAQSVFRTFFRRAGGCNPFRLDDTEALWNLLCAISLPKVREKVRFHRRHRRGVDREVGLSASDDSISPAARIADRGPAPEDAIEFADQFDHLFASLDPEEQDLLRQKLDGLTNEKAAERLGRLERTVRRLVKRLQSPLARAFPGAEA